MANEARHSLHRPVAPLASVVSSQADRTVVSCLSKPSVHSENALDDD